MNCVNWFNDFENWTCVDSSGCNGWGYRKPGDDCL